MSHDDVSPSTGQPFQFKPNGRVSTNWATLGGLGTSLFIVVGGLFSIKGDIATAQQAASGAARDAMEARKLAEDIRAELYRLRLDLAGSLSNVITTRKQIP